MKYTVKFLPRAETDLMRLPESLQDEILAKAEKLAEFPRMGIALERAFADYRCVLAGRNRYRIVYRIKAPATVEIAYIRHCRRKMGLRTV